VVARVSGLAAIAFASPRHENSLKFMQAISVHFQVIVI
jgi:hypothetical protein